MPTETRHAGTINRAVFCITFFSNFSSRPFCPLISVFLLTIQAGPLPIVPRDQNEPADQPEVLEEGIRGHEPLLARGQLPEAQRDQRCHERKACDSKSSEPPVEAGENHDRGTQLQSNHCDGERTGWRKAEVLYLRDRAAEIGRLDNSTLQIGRAQTEQRYPMNQRCSEPHRDALDCVHVTLPSRSSPARPRRSRSSVGTFNPHACVCPCTPQVVPHPQAAAKV